MGQTKPQTPSSIFIRPGTSADTYQVFTVFYHSLSDLFLRMGLATQSEVQEAGRLSRWWADWQSLFEHLGRTAEQFWIAERDGQVIGFARSILRGGVRELTELFVLPGEQSSGLGRELLQRALPSEGASHRTILATVDTRALARYMKAGVYPFCPVATFWGSPQIRVYQSDLAVVPMQESPEAEGWLNDLDSQVLGFQRPVDHAWLRRNRQGFFYLRDQRPAAYAYVGKWSGPVAVLKAGDMSNVLAHLETQANQLGLEEFGLDVPLINRTAADTLLQREFKLGSFIVFVMTDQNFANLENYILSSPEFFL